MTNLRTPENAERIEFIPEDELVPADDTIVGKAFVWSLLVFAILAICIGGMTLILNQPEQVAAPKQVKIVPPKSLERPSTPPPRVPFVNITEAAGIDFVRENGASGEKLLPETMGGGCGFFDYDNDGDQDFLLVNSTYWPHDGSANRLLPTHALYRNNGIGQFENAIAGSGLDVSFYGMGVAFGDFDNDGDQDVFITAVGRNHLFENEGEYFRDVTERAGVAGDDQSWSTSAGFFDYDNDGNLDLFVCNYVKWSREIDFAVDYKLTGIGRAYGPPTNFEGTHNYLYRNNGDGTFTDVSKKSGIEIENLATGQPMGKALGVSPIDIDSDGWIDVLVANDTVQNFLFHNQGDETFLERGAEFGIAFDRNGHATGAMGIDSAHYRNDDALGFGIGNFANEMTSLYVSQGRSSLFADEAIADGIGATTRLMLTFGLFFFDCDLDGRLDLLQCNGHLEEEINIVQPSQHYEQPTQLFWNAGADEQVFFTPVLKDQVGDLSYPIVGRGAAYADIDGDGDLDVILTQPRGRPMLLRNDQHLGHHWLQVKLTGTISNRDAIGAWIEVESNGVTQRRQVMPTKSYLSQVELPVTFGFENDGEVEVVRVLWPDGSQDEKRNINMNQRIFIEQGGGT